MRTFVKFCGLTDAESVRQVPAGGAAGFVVGVPLSPRNLTFEDAARLLRELPEGREGWAVVVRPPPEVVRRLIQEVGVDRVQVHGIIPDGLGDREVRRIVPSVSVHSETPDGPDPSELPPAAQFPCVQLDAPDPVRFGGTGRRPDWRACARLVAGSPGRQIVLGGGLAPENVVEALRTVRPWGVDVSSGIEWRPGAKDPERMQAFIENIERWERSDD